MAITKPQNWTPHAMFQATKMFASNFDSMRAETFFIEVWDLPNTVFVASSQIRLEEEQKAELPLF